MGQISRREMLKRGAVTGAAVVWVTPVVQTIGMSRALAQEASPPPTTTTTTTAPPPDTDISYIAMNVHCDDGAVGDCYFVKHETDTGWDEDPGATPKCEDLFTSSGTAFNGGELAISVVTNADGTVSVFVPAECEVTSSVSKAGQNCCTGPTGSGELVFSCSS